MAFYDKYEDIRKMIMKMIREMVIDAEDMDYFLEGILDKMENSIRADMLLSQRLDESSMGYLTPIISINEGRDELVITIDLPGSDPGTISVDVMPDKISIEAKIKEEIARKAFGQAYWANKIKEYRGVYSLPHIVDPKSIIVKKKNGILIIRVKKA
ncbi:MAG: Hsp20/alpha crystallin family protein [Caldisphaeraceae archaeon]|nr:Hsp20/alpha crystallin family protein [Caldisphaeraceae archaeon]